MTNFTGDWNPWIKEHELVPEQQFTPWADERPAPMNILPIGLLELAPVNLLQDWTSRWLSWNSMSPEFQFTLMAAWQIRQIQSQRPEDEGVIVVETGLGQGYVTRAMLKVMDSGLDTLFSYDTEQPWIDMVVGGGVCLTTGLGSPGGHMMAKADLVVLDSNSRLDELLSWIAHGHRDSRLLIHDTFHHLTPPGEYTDWLNRYIKNGDLWGEYIDAPRGWFLGRHL
jgi:hypothetical protein